ncbi:hypothetical protein L1987_61507 [Smallanthus sonchifolius]|uniref:Uncharacterized protein n=1 Tax=Smallanthus sonchifolius TaxID=185202 RepID=A0ACB9C7R2_9ASTR|nr:hypothetical protein L1987_61507 [Smallanthus sonchifolius]
MSRCFPYPPPGYCRNGATYEALIESIKLQKENDKAKAERKKEKRAKKEKKEKEKEKRKNDEKVKLQNNQSQDSHKLQKVAGFTEAQIKGTKTNTELLEKSDLTEEHGQPIKPSYSSDSTQNSNKRRRDDDALLPDDSPSHGKPIKIRFFKKPKGSDSSNSFEDARLNTVPLVQSSNRNNGVPATSGRENNKLQNIPLTQTKSNSSCDRTKSSNPNALHLDGERCSIAKPGFKLLKPILPSSFDITKRKSDVEVLKSSRQQPQIASFVRPVVRQSRHLEHEIPSSSESRNIVVQGPDSDRHQQQGLSNLKPGIPNPVSNKPNSITTGKRPINEITVLGNGGPTKPEKKKEVAPTRTKKKLLKKKAKYEKLIGSWAPPVFQALIPDVVEDDDWLSRRTKSASSSVPRVEVESCRESAATSLWQPHARFLAEADIHALPYTVPF